MNYQQYDSLLRENKDMRVEIATLKANNEQFKTDCQRMVDALEQKIEQKRSEQNFGSSVNNSMNQANFQKKLNTLNNNINYLNCGTAQKRQMH